MKKLVAGCLVVALVPVVLFLGMTLPPRHIGTGVERFEGEKRKMAELAFRMGGEFVADVPGPGVFITAYKVMDVKECPTTPALEREARLNPPQPPAPPPFDAPRFAAEFQRYTIFGIPAGTASIPCEDS